MLFFPELNREKALSAAGMTETPEEDEYNEAPFSGGEPDPGTYMIWQNWDTGSLESSEYPQIAARTKLVVCDISETTMTCSTVAFENGEAIWVVTHDPDSG